jgi:hypothetical protein
MMRSRRTEEGQGKILQIQIMSHSKITEAWAVSRWESETENLVHYTPGDLELGAILERLRIAQAVSNSNDGGEDSMESIVSKSQAFACSLPDALRGRSSKPWPTPQLF